MAKQQVPEDQTPAAQKPAEQVPTVHQPPEQDGNLRQSPALRLTPEIKQEPDMEGTSSVALSFVPAAQVASQASSSQPLSQVPSQTPPLPPSSQTSAGTGVDQTFTPRPPTRAGPPAGEQARARQCPAEQANGGERQEERRAVRDLMEESFKGMCDDMVQRVQANVNTTVKAMLDEKGREWKEELQVQASPLTHHRPFQKRRTNTPPSSRDRPGTSLAFPSFLQPFLQRFLQSFPASKSTRARNSATPARTPFPTAPTAPTPTRLPRLPRLPLPPLPPLPRPPHPPPPPPPPPTPRKSPRRIIRKREARKTTSVSGAQRIREKRCRRRKSSARPTPKNTRPRSRR